MAYYQLAQAYERLGHCDSAFDALLKAGLFSSGNSKVLSLRGHVLATLGRTGEARDLLHTLEAVSREKYVPPYAFALVRARWPWRNRGGAGVTGARVRRA